MNSKFKALIGESIELLDQAIDALEGDLTESKEYKQLMQILDALEYMHSH